METTTASSTERIAKALDSLPTLPIVALRIGEVIHSKNASVAQVSAILRTDPATCAKLLRLVNSPYFGIPGGVADIERAIPFVGFNTLYQLVLTISVLDTLKGASDVRALWTHSLIVATAARELAVEVRFSDPGVCFTAGLLHDMGKIALAKIEPTAFGAVFKSMRDEGLAIHEAEEKHGLACHDHIGSRLARQWKFPATLATPIEQHHAIHQLPVRERLAPNLRTITEVVTMADHLSGACARSFGAFEICEDGDANMDALVERNGLAQATRDAVIDRTRTELERSRVFLSLVD